MLHTARDGRGAVRLVLLHGCGGHQELLLAIRLVARVLLLLLLLLLLFGHLGRCPLLHLTGGHYSGCCSIIVIAIDDHIVIGSYRPLLYTDGFSRRLVGAC